MEAIQREIRTILIVPDVKCWKCIWSVNWISQTFIRTIWRTNIREIEWDCWLS